MTERWWHDAEVDATHEAAAEWFARLQKTDIAADELLAWQRWLAADPRNAEAFDRLEEICGMLRDVPRPTTGMKISSIGAGAPWHHQYDGTETISTWRARTASHGWFAVVASIAATVVLVAGGLSLWNTGGTAATPAEIVQTSVGENRTVQLADGSRVTLGGDTLLRAAFSDTGRHIELTRGEALFSVAKDRTRPFSVQAGRATVVAVGTQFNVRRHEDRTDVAVVEGEVVVAPASRGESSKKAHERPASAVPQISDVKAIRVSAGEKTIVGSEGVQAAARFADAAAPVAWRFGRLVFEREPLRGVVEDVNRYSKKPVVIEDEALGEAMFTGTVLNGNIDGWIASIEEVFSLDAVEEPGRVVLRRRQ